MAKTTSPYSASFTGATMMYNEMNIVVEKLLENDSPETVKALRTDAQYLMIKSSTSRERVASELVKRFRTMPVSFWKEYLGLGEKQQRLALFFVILKTYKVLFEFQVNLAIPKYNSVDRVLTKNDAYAALAEIASRDEFVDSWTAETRDRVASHYVTMVKQAGLSDKETGELRTPDVSDQDLLPYIKTGDVWFLQACFLPSYRIEQIKQLSI
jgi:hypothetical protein